LEDVKMEVVVVLEATVVGEAEVENYQVVVDLMVAKEEEEAAVMIRMEVEAAVTPPRVEEEVAVAPRAEEVVAVTPRAEEEVAVTPRAEVEVAVMLRKGEVGAAKAITMAVAVEEVKTVEEGEEVEVREAMVETPQVMGGQLRYS